MKAQAYNLTKAELKGLYKELYGKYPPTQLKKAELKQIILSSLHGGGIGDFIRNSASSTFSFLKKGYNKVKDKFKPIDKIEDKITKNFNYRTDYTNETKRTLKEVGDKPINNIMIVRTPVQKTLINILNTLSFGYFKELMHNYGFDNFFHLSLICSINGRYVVVEKNAEINVSFNVKQNKHSESTPVEKYQGGLNLNQMLQKTREFMGDKKYFDYDAFSNNCQNFILSILEANNLSSDRTTKFIYQDISEIYDKLKKNASYLSPVSKVATRLGAWWNKITGAGSVLTKKKPQNYGINTIEIIKALSFNINNVEVMGSSAIKATLYPSDFDLYEVVKVNNLNKFVKEFQNKIKELIKAQNIYLIYDDIKIGEYRPFEILPNIYKKNNKLIGYNPNQIKEDIKNKLSFLSETEKAKLYKLIKENPTPAELAEIKDALRFHIMRWTADEVLNGKKTLLNGETITLKQAFKTDGLIKIDALGFTRNKYMDFSIIYELRDKQNKRINNYRVNIKDTLNDQIKTYIMKGEYYKALKREYSKLKHIYTYNKSDKIKEKTLKRLQELTNFFNGEVGILYSVINDIVAILTLINLETRTNNDKIKNTIESFIYRLSNIYSVNSYLKKENNILQTIRTILKQPQTMEQNLNKLKDILKNILNIHTKKFILR